MQMEYDEKLLWDESYRCPTCNGRVQSAGFSGDPFCFKCFKYVDPVRVDPAHPANKDTQTDQK